MRDQKSTENKSKHISTKNFSYSLGLCFVFYLLKRYEFARIASYAGLVDLSKK